MKTVFITLSILTAVCLTQCAHFRVTSQVYMDVSIDNEPIGQITIGLFGEDAPKTVENFRQICINGINGQTYAGTRFHRVVDRLIIQGGDIVYGDGRGSVSIYGKHFEDENLTINHTGPGFLGMPNRGRPDTNGCQFYITTMMAPWLNGQHVLFGKVVKGAAYVHVIEKTKTNSDNVPVKDIVITACGDAPMFSTYYTISDNPYDLAAWIRASALPLGFSFIVLMFFHSLIRKLDNVSKEALKED